MGGTSGALYGVFFIRLAAKIRLLLSEGQLDAFGWAAALKAGTEGITSIGGAKVCFFLLFKYLL